MTVDKALQTALAGCGLPVVPQVYRGDALEYLVTNHSAVPSVYAERAPQACRHLVQVHYYLPEGKNPNTTLVTVSRALWEGGFTWPSTEDAGDTEGQHWVLECEYVNGGAYYGEI